MKMASRLRLCALTLCLLTICSPSFSQPNYNPSQLYFGAESIAKQYIVVEITTKKGEKVWGNVVGETENDLWMITKKAKIEIWPKERIDHISILRIFNKKDSLKTR